ncbi:hypothetical protein HMPREF9696_00085 [Afipia clevelandensis ATCC 49720]|uniref:Uncharacterized protein n=1 Tax=Afipia clevelandensis ATCC 49720 TaxID=883079 RepID=K8PIQ8_9BRAD|nr:hypothetical protein HMPREF9696_00085 [Afipia clevelandensis ATCC 49720]
MCRCEATRTGILFSGKFAVNALFRADAMSTSTRRAPLL